MEKHPKKCNLCGGEVIFTDNSVVYGKKYGSGKCYLCLSCGAYVGTHKPRPKEALGLLADKEMRKMKIACHDLFDQLWNTREERNKEYKRLAKCMNIPVEECHFGYMDKKQLRQAYEILKIQTS